MKLNVIAVLIIPLWILLVAGITPRGGEYPSNVSWLDWAVSSSVYGPSLKKSPETNSPPLMPQSTVGGGDSVAFPGAIGFGAEALTTCNRDTVFVHKVTNTNSNGPGSLDTVRYQLHADTLDVVVFTTGGYTTGGSLSGSSNNLGAHRLDCVYYMGQSSPGDGFNVTDTYGGWFRIDGGTEDIVVRGLGFLGGPTDQNTSSPHGGVYDIDRGIFDRNFFAWCREACISGGVINTSDRNFNTTYSRNHWYQPNAIEPTLWQSTICGPDECGTGSMAETFDRITLSENLMNSGSHRNPVISGRGDGQDNSGPAELGGVAQIVGHMIYNWNQGGIQFKLWTQLDILDTYFREGPMSGLPTPDSRYQWQIEPEMDSTTTDNSDSIYFYARLHADRSIGFHNKDPNIPRDSLHVEGGGHQTISCYRDHIPCDPGGSTGNWDGVPEAWVGNSFYVDTTITQPTFPPPRKEPHTELYDTLVTDGHVGTHMRVDSLGNIANRLDSLQDAALQEIIDTTGISNHPQVDSVHIEAKNDYLDNLDTGTAWRDGDGDGVADACEERYYGDNSNPPQYDSDGDGWTLIEECWNGTNPTVFENSAGTAISNTIGGGDSVAFAGATGFGAHTLTQCSRDTVIVGKVTSTSATGPGTLDSLGTEWGNNAFNDTLKVVVFETGGYIDGVTENWRVNAPYNCVAIFGQSAPGDGYVKEDDFPIGHYDDSHDILWQNITFLGRPTNVNTENPHMGFSDAKRIYLDRITCAFVREKCFRIVTNSDNDTIHDFTVDRFIASEPNAIEATSLQVVDCDTSLGCTLNTTDLDRVTLTSIVCNSVGWRCPNMGGDRRNEELMGVSQVIGLVGYNSRRAYAQAGTWTQLDLVDFIVRSGPMTRSTSPWPVSIDGTSPLTSGTELDNTKIYVDALYGESNANASTSVNALWTEAGDSQEVACYRPDCPGTNYDFDSRDTLGSGIAVDTAMTQPDIPSPRRDSATLWNDLIVNRNSGASVYVDSLGNPSVRVDSLTEAIQDLVSAGTGGISSINEPDSAYISARIPYSVATGTAWRDTDNDGVADACEERYYGDLDEPAHSDTDNDGWTLIEECWSVKGTSPIVFNASDGSEVGTGGFASTFASTATNPNVYRLDTATYLDISVDSSGNNLDTVTYVGYPNMDSLIALGLDEYRLYKIADSVYLLVTPDTVSGRSPLDSAEAVNRCNTDPGCTVGDMRDTPILGPIGLHLKEIPKPEYSIFGESIGIA